MMAPLYRIEEAVYYGRRDGVSIERTILIIEYARCILLDHAMDIWIQNQR